MSFRPPGRGGAAAPPDVWIVIVGLVALAVVLLIPTIKTFSDIAPNMFSGPDYERAFAYLGVELIAVVFAVGVALIGLAVGLARASRVAQILTCLLSATIAIAEIASAQSTSAGYGTSSASHSTALIVALIAVGVIVLLTARQPVRAFFALDRRPVGVALAAICNACIGAVLLLDGTLLMLSGIIGAKYVWFGLGLSVAGGLLWGVNRGLRAGKPAARAWTVVVQVAMSILLLIFANQTDSTSSPATLIPLGISISVILGLTLPSSSRQHFAAPSNLGPLRGLGVAALAAAVVLVVVCAAVGFSESSKTASLSSSSDYATPTDTPTYGSDPFSSDTPTPQATESFAPASLSHSWTLTEDNGSGDSIDVTFNVGDPEPATMGLTQGDLTLDQTCSDIDPSVDAVIPAEVVIANNTSTSQLAGYTLDYSGGSVNEAEIVYTSGTSCVTSGDINTGWDNGIEAGSTGASNMFFVIHNYYANGSSGDQDALSNATVQFTDSSVNGSDGESADWTPNSPQGPDVGDNDTIPLAG